MAERYPDLPDDVESTGIVECRLAERKIHDAERDVRQTHTVSEGWRSTLDFLRELYTKNGFGEDMTKIMMKPARAGSER